MKVFSDMFLKSFIVASSFAALASAGCVADNCLRAVRATSRLAWATTDCSSFFAIPTVTYTDTLTFSETAYSTTLITKTTTIEVTVSTSVDTTTTTILTINPTTTQYVSIPLRKRDEEVRSIPAYASPCSGAVRFSSACACIGISSPTVTPSTTVTTSTTLSFSTVQTNFETTTVYTTVATKTQTNVDVVTNTVGGVATQTFKPFQIEVTFPGNSVKYLKPFVRFSSSSIIYTGFADTRAEAPYWYLDGTTVKTLAGDVLACQVGPTWAWVYARNYSSALCVCAIDAARKLTCTGSGNSIFVAWDLRLSIAATPGSVWGNYQFVSLKAIQ